MDKNLGHFWKKGNVQARGGKKNRGEGASAMPSAAFRLFITF